MVRVIFLCGYVFVALLFFFSPMCLGMEERPEQSPSPAPRRGLNRNVVNESSPLVPIQRSTDLRNRVRPLQRAVEAILHDESSAVTIYNLKTDRGRNWDNLDQFLDNLDRALFQISPTRTKVATGLASLPGCFIPVFLSNTVLHSLGGVLDKDLGAGVSTGLETWIITTTMPVALDLTADLAGGAVSLCSTQQAFSSSRGEDPDEVNNPHVFPMSKGHRAALVILFVTSGLDAAIPTLLIFNAEAPFSVGKWISVACILPFYWKTYWDIGKANINYAFNNYVHQTDEADRTKRRIIAKKVQLFQDAINHPDRPKSDKLVKLVYQALSEKLKRQKLRRAQAGADPQQQEPSNRVELDPEALEDLEISVFSLLMTKDAKRDDMTHVSAPEREPESELDEVPMQHNTLEEQILVLQKKIQGLEEENAQISRAFKQAASLHADLGSLQPPSWKEDLLSAVATGLTGAALAARFEILRSTIQNGLQQLGVDEESAQNASYSIAGPASLFRVVVESRLHQQQFKGWLKALSVSNLGDFRFLRKGFNIVSTINGSLFASPSFYVGFAFSSLSPYPLLGKLSLLIPSALLDFSLFKHVLEERHADSITAVATLGSEDIGVERQRAHLNRWATKVQERIVPTSGERVFDQETIANIYSLMQENALKNKS